MIRLDPKVLQQQERMAKATEALAMFLSAIPSGELTFVGRIAETIGGKRMRGGSGLNETIAKAQAKQHRDIFAVFRRYVDKARGNRWFREAGEQLFEAAAAGRAVRPREEARRVAKKVYEDAVEQVKQAILASRVSFAPLSKKYAEWKRRFAPGPILVLTGQLVESMRVKLKT